MNLYDNMSIILIALILNKGELDFDHPTSLTSVTLNKNKLNINSMLTLFFFIFRCQHIQTLKMLINILNTQMKF